MGCYAALPGLGTVADFTVARDRPSVLLCLELTSLHLQPPTTDVDQVVAHALFADAAAAVVLQPSAGPGFEVVDVVAQTDPSTADYMTWDVTDLGFRMGLSPRVPAVLARHVRGVVDRLLAGHGLTLADVDGWAVHPGGRRIVDVVADRLQLDADQVAASRSVLDRYGNCSSPTVLMVLAEIRARERLTSGEPVIAMAFGPGLTLCTALLRAC
jgi:predicted naringenin-chalcone synthase